MADCRHNWHFIEGTDRLRCERCKAETGPKTYEQRVKDFLQDPWTTEQLTMANAPLYTFHDPRPSTITFFGMKDNDNIEVMRLSRDGVWANPDIPTDEAAKLVLAAIDSNIKLLVDQAVATKLDAVAAKVKTDFSAAFGADTCESWAVWIRSQK